MHKRSNRKDCRRCGRDSVYRSRLRNLPERALALFGIYPFTCLGCNFRFFRHLTTAKSGRAIGLFKKTVRIDMKKQTIAQPSNNRFRKLVAGVFSSLLLVSLLAFGMTVAANRN